MDDVLLILLAITCSQQPVLSDWWYTLFCVHAALSVGPRPSIQHGFSQYEQMPNFFLPVSVHCPVVVISYRSCRLY